MIHIVDYGLGNIQAFVTMYKRLGLPVSRAQTAQQLQGATRIILPGVGSFDYAMELLNSSGMRDQLELLVQERNVPVLGICVGMQILAESSEEGVGAGLGWVKGTVRSFSNATESADLPLPHMGWNDVQSSAGCPLFRGIENDARFYFLHSYYFDAEQKVDVAARATYGFEFDSVVQRKNVFGVQFHPEKSHHWGVALLRNFAEFESC